MTQRTADEVSAEIKQINLTLRAAMKSTRMKYRRRLGSLCAELAAIERTQDERAE